ncbi:condensation domain-containing protein [Streptomyces sp. M19]
MLADIVTAVLGTDRIGAEDSFLALGGDSVTSLQVAAKATAAGYRLTSRQVLEAESVRLLAAAAEAAPAPPVRGTRPPARCRSPHPTLVLRAGVPRLALLGPGGPRRTRRTRRRGAARRRARPSRPPPRRAAQPLHRDRRALVPDRPRAPRGHRRRGRRRRGRNGGGPAAGGRRVRQERIDLAAGPLVTAAVLRAADGGPGRLLLALHHLVVDGVSLRILVEDLETAYRALRAGAPVRLPARTTSFRGWSRALGRYARSPEVTGQLDYWRGVPSAAAARLPVDRPAATNVMADAAKVSVTLDAELTHRLVHEVPGPVVVPRCGTCSWPRCCWPGGAASAVPRSSSTSRATAGSRSATGPT